MDLVRTAAELRSRLKNEPSVVLVPTMGNLHAGHIALVEAAKRHGRCVAASIFVNRLQFDPGGDFDRYPRTLDNDCRMLANAGCHVAFAPDEGEMYPAPQEIVITPPKVSEPLEGEFRPGHFQGVATVVAKLFNLFTPQVAVFGKKDYQQLRVIRALVQQLNFGIEIVGVETVRESDGLALSSRNGYLSPTERSEAIRLGRALRGVKDKVEQGATDYDAITRAAAGELASHGWRVDYVALRRRADLVAPAPGERELVALGAAWLGKTRLIDNLEVGS
ncbi:MAG TPA: pantoate--beta-alanine ligase [Usitatibacter sp.]|jgi:pantoate--beta-alanine ligase|nr:pantoate--beta-alanine ligase [Usitatibacter sp.]